MKVLNLFFKKEGEISISALEQVAENPFRRIICMLTGKRPRTTSLKHRLMASSLVTTRLGKRV